MDPIVEDLTRYAEEDDRQAHGRALDALSREWRPVLRRQAAEAPPEELEDRLQQALLELAVKDAHGRIRALASTEGSDHQKYRITVLRNWLRDHWRRRNRRAHAEKAVAAGLSPQTEKQQWRNRREAPPMQVVEVAHAPPPEIPELHGLLDKRQALLASLHTVPIRGRVLVLLAIGADATHHAEALAKAIHDSPEVVTRRMHAASRAPHDHQHDYLSGAMVEVVYPTGDPEKNRESARKALERAMRDLGRLVAS